MGERFLQKVSFPKSAKRQNPFKIKDFAVSVRCFAACLSPELAKWGLEIIDDL